MICLSHTHPNYQLPTNTQRSTKAETDRPEPIRGIRPIARRRPAYELIARLRESTEDTAIEPRLIPSQAFKSIQRRIWPCISRNCRDKSQRDEHAGAVAEAHVWSER
jgi:hypothetical protein